MTRITDLSGSYLPVINSQLSLRALLYEIAYLLKYWNATTANVYWTYNQKANGKAPTGKPNQLVEKTTSAKQCAS